MELFFPGLFLLEFVENLSATMYAFTNSHLVGTLLSIYGVAFGSLMVVYALVAPRAEKMKGHQKTEQLKGMLDKVLNTAFAAFFLIFVNLAFYLPDVAKMYLIGFAAIEIIGFPWMFGSMIEILLRLKEIFYLV